MIDRHYLYERIKLVWMMPAFILVIILWGLLLLDITFVHQFAKPDMNVDLYGFAATLAILLLAFVYVELKYRNYYYEFRNDGLRICHGILERRIDQIPYTKIQHVRAERTIFEHLLSMVHIHIEMAGMTRSESEPSIPGVPLDAYEEMIEYIKNHGMGDTNNSEGALFCPPTTQDETMRLILDELRMINKRLAKGEEDKPKPLKKLTEDEEKVLKRHKKSDLGQLEEENIRTHL